MEAPRPLSLTYLPTYIMGTLYQVRGRSIADLQSSIDSYLHQLRDLGDGPKEGEQGDIGFEHENAHPHVLSHITQLRVPGSPGIGEID